METNARIAAQRTPPDPAALPPSRRVRSRELIGALAILAATVWQAPLAHATDPNHVRLSIVKYGAHLGAPTAVVFPPDNTGRAFVLDQAGLVRVRVSGKGFLAKPYLDIRSRVKSGGEQGLLGFAFHPKFASTGLFYVSYTDSAGALRVSRFHATPSANSASASTEALLMRIAHPTNTNHNAGQLAFGPDGYLYIGTGDGGGGGDPPGNAQSLARYLGKILRIDVTRACGSLRYCVPHSNPFYGMKGRIAEIWEYGLRNPWKFSFDKGTGVLWVADVGQGAWEEITPISAGIGGRNLGWDCREGTANTVSQYGGSYCSGRTFMNPLFVYGHTAGRCAIIGGFVYRGRTYRSVMDGMYLYADYCTGEVWGLAKQPNGAWRNALVFHHSATITTFSETPTGELFFADGNGNLYKIAGVAR
jgi:glucose/arabinose dehydrogenase